MDAMECIKTRRSIRKYEEKSVSPLIIRQILDTSIFAPSGKNGKPWRFKIVTDKNIISEIGNMTIFSRWSKSAPCLIFVFLDKTQSYDYIKDVQSCGAVVQNILLSAHALGISSCWIGEVMAQSEKILRVLNIQNECVELMAMVTLGYGINTRNSVERKSLQEFLI